MSKLIIHNETEMADLKALEYIYQVIEWLKEAPTLSFCEFNDNIGVQVYHQKTCDTYYVYNVGGYNE